MTSQRELNALFTSEASDMIKGMCEGCKIDSMSQKDHDCVMISLHDKVAMTFEEIFERKLPIIKELLLQVIQDSL